MADAYKVAVSLVMQSNAPAFFSALSSKILHTHAQVKDLEGGLTRLSRIKLAVGGGLALAGGAAMLSQLGKVLDKGAEYQRMQNNMRLAGMKETEIANATAKAWEMTAKYRSLGVVRIGDMINEVRSVFGDTASAVANIEPALKAATVLQSTLKGKNQEGIVGQVFDMFKSADLRNITDDPKATEKFFDQMTKIVSVTGGKITPKDFLQMQKYAKSAGQTWSDEFIIGPVASMMQEGSPSTVGTALTSLDQAIVGGRMTDKAAAAFGKLGLVHPSAMKAFSKKDGSLREIEQGGVEGSDLFRTNPYEWVQKVLKPAIMDKITNGGKIKLSEEDAIAKSAPWLSTMFGNRNAEWIANTMYKERPIERDIALGKTAQGLGGADLLLKKDWFTAVKAFTTQWDNLMTALGAPLVGQATEALNKFTASLAGLAQWAALKENEATIIALGKGIAILSASLVGAGGAALLAALGPAGWLVLGIGAAAAAAETAKPGYLKTVASDLVEFWGAIAKLDFKVAVTAAIKGLNDLLLGAPAQIAKAIGDMGNRLGDLLVEGVRSVPDLTIKEIASWPARLAEAITAMGAAIVQKLKDVFNSLNPFSKASFEGGEGGGGIGGLVQNASFGGGGANDNIARALGGGGAGGSGGSGNISTPLPASAGLRGEVQSYLRAKAASMGIDPNVAERVMKQESGFNPYARNINSRERSYGVFQLNTMGGLGNVAQRQGIDPTDPSQWKKHIDFGLGVVKRDGWRQWYGARDVGISRWQGIGRGPITHREAPPSGDMPRGKAPTAGPPPKAGGKTEVLHVNLDGAKMAEVVLKRGAEKMRFTRHVGGMDSHGSWRPPGTTLTDAA